MTRDDEIHLYIFDIVLCWLSSFESLIGQISRFNIVLMYHLASATYTSMFFHICVPMFLFEVVVGLYF